MGLFTKDFREEFKDQLRVDPAYCKDALEFFSKLVSRMRDEAQGNEMKMGCVSLLDSCQVMAEEGAEWMAFDSLAREEAVDKLAFQLALYCLINGLDKAEAAEMISLMLERIIKMEDI